MDCIESPFPFEEADALFPLPSLPSIDIPFPISSNDINLSQSQPHIPKQSRRRRKSPPVSDELDGENTIENQKKKKIIHRDVERQRRQEMSTLYSTLRSLLPLEYLKGKRSICDHMHETVKYIQHMQKKIQQLSNKRDELKRISGECLPETLQSSQRDCVVVQRRCGGVQVFLETATEHRLPVSDVVKALQGEGLEINGCISTKIKGRLMHTIESNVGGRSIDLPELQQKLANLEYFPLD